MNLSYKYRLHLSKKQEATLNAWLPLAMDLYNELNSICLDKWHKREKVPSKYDLCDFTKQEKYSPVHALVRQNIAERIALAWKAFFRQLKEPHDKPIKEPKNKDKYKSFTFPQPANSFVMKDVGLIRLGNIGPVKFKEHRPYKGNVKRATVKVSPTGKWYLILACENIPISNPLPLSGKIVGIDMNKGTNLLTLSDGTIVDRVRIKDRACQVRIRDLDRKIYRARQEENSIRLTKLYRKMAHVEERVANRRDHYLHIVANDLIKKYDILVVEDLNIQSMLDNTRDGNRRQIVNENRNTLDCGWYKLRSMLEYKAVIAGKKTIAINPKNTSKTCSSCGHIKTDLELSDRTFVCPGCGLSIDRDLNASLNILRLGHQSLEANAS